MTNFGKAMLTVIHEVNITAQLNVGYLKLLWLLQTESFLNNKQQRNTKALAQIS